MCQRSQRAYSFSLYIAKKSIIDLQNVHVLYLLWRIKFLLLIKFVNLIDKMILTILSYFTPFRKQTTYIHRIFSYKYVSRFTKFLFSTNLPNKMTVSEGINVRDFYYA